MKPALALMLIAFTVFACSFPRDRPTSNAPTVPVSALTLIAAYEENEVAADNSYKNRILAVSGIVDSVGKDIMDNPYVMLSSGKEFSINSVQCITSESNGRALASLRKGNSVTVVGLCKGKTLGTVLLDDCRLR